MYNNFQIYAKSGVIKQPNYINEVALNSQKYFNFGVDNLFPYELAYLNRTSPTHQGILRNKIDLFTGNEWILDDKILETPNNTKQELKEIAENWATDFEGSGNGALLIATNKLKNFMNLFNIDVTNVRIGKDAQGKENDTFVIQNFQTKSYIKKGDALVVPKFPDFAKVKGKGSTLYSLFYYKKYVPNFPVYGLPTFSSVLDSASIQRLTNEWNRNRVANGFPLDGIITQEFTSQGEVDKAREDLEDLKKDIAKTGNILFMPKGVGKGNSQFTQLTATKEGEWTQLHIQAQADIFIAHQWKRSLVGAEIGGKLSTANTILADWEYVMGSHVLGLQKTFKGIIQEIYSTVLGVDIDYKVINNEPVTNTKILEYKATGVKKWQILQKLGIEYDEKDKTLNEEYV